MKKKNEFVYKIKKEKSRIKINPTIQTFFLSFYLFHKSYYFIIIFLFLFLSQKTKHTLLNNNNKKYTI